MKRAFGLLLLSSVIVSGCVQYSDGEPVNDTKENEQIEEETVEPAEQEQEQDNLEEVEVVEESASSLTADDVVEAFETAGLSLVDPRDNTDKQCGEGNMPCSQLITTEDVSIFLWPSEEEAVSIGEEYHDHSAGFFTLRFNEPLSPEEEYKKVLDELVTN